MQSDRNNTWSNNVRSQDVDIEKNTVQVSKTSLIPEQNCQDVSWQKCQTLCGQHGNTNYNEKYTIKEEKDYRARSKRSILRHRNRTAA